MVGAFLLTLKDSTAKRFAGPGTEPEPEIRTVGTVFAGSEAEEELQNLFSQEQKLVFLQDRGIPLLKLHRNTAETKKAYTTTTERKSFGELFWPQRKTFQAGGRYRKSY